MTRSTRRHLSTRPPTELWVAVHGTEEAIHIAQGSRHPEDIARARSAVEKLQIEVSALARKASAIEPRTRTTTPPPGMRK